MTCFVVSCIQAQTSQTQQINSRGTLNRGNTMKTTIETIGKAITTFGLNDIVEIETFDDDTIIVLTLNDYKADRGQFSKWVELMQIVSLSAETLDTEIMDCFGLDIIQENIKRERILDTDFLKNFGTFDEYVSFTSFLKCLDGDEDFEEIYFLEQRQLDNYITQFEEYQADEWEYQRELSEYNTTLYSRSYKW